MLKYAAARAQVAARAPLGRARRPGAQASPVPQSDVSRLADLRVNPQIEIEDLNIVTQLFYAILREH